MTDSQIMIVTGGGRGIGAATARMAAARGYAVCVNYLGNAGAAEAVVHDIEGAGGRAIAVQANVAAEAEVERLFETVDRELGPVTALVNNAGLSGHIDRLDAAPSETIRQVIEAAGMKLSVVRAYDGEAFHLDLFAGPRNTGHMAPLAVADILLFLLASDLPLLVVVVTATTIGHV